MKRKSSVGIIAFAFALITLSVTLASGLFHLGKINSQNKLIAQNYQTQLMAQIEKTENLNNLNQNYQTQLIAQIEKYNNIENYNDKSSLMEEQKS